MTDFASIINGINKATEMVGAVNGAISVLAPAAQQMNYTINGMANAVNPYRQDYYAQPPMYYPPNGAYVPPPTNNVNFSSGPDESSVIGTIGNALGGAAIGAWQGVKLARAIRPPVPKPPATPPTTPPGGGAMTAEAIKLTPNAKAAALSGLKAGGIGAAIGGIFSGIENISRMANNEITGAEATGNIVADTTVGFFSGLGGVAAGGATALAMGAMGMAGLPVTIGAAALGLVGAVGADMLLRKTGIRQSIADGVRSMVG